MKTSRILHVILVVLWIGFAGGGHEICNPIPDTTDLFVDIGENVRLLWNYTTSSVTMVRLCHQRDPKLQANFNAVCPKGYTSLLTLATDGKLAYMGDTLEDLKLFHKMEFVGQVDIGKFWFVLKNVTKKDFGMRFQLLLRLADGKKHYADCYHESVPGIHLKETPTPAPMLTSTRVQNTTATTTPPYNAAGTKKRSLGVILVIIALVFIAVVTIAMIFIIYYLKRIFSDLLSYLVCNEMYLPNVTLITYGGRNV